jgi:hypothetical protein
LWLGLEFLDQGKWGKVPSSDGRVCKESVTISTTDRARPRARKRLLNSNLSPAPFPQRKILKVTHHKVSRWETEPGFLESFLFDFSYIGTASFGREDRNVCPGKNEGFPQKPQI